MSRNEANLLHFMEQGFQTLFTGPAREVNIYQFGLPLEESGTRLHVYVKQTAQEEGIKEGWE